MFGSFHFMVNTSFFKDSKILHFLNRQIKLLYQKWLIKD